VNELNDAVEGGDMGILPDSQIAGRNAAFRKDGRGLYDDQASTTLGTDAEMDEMPIRGEAVLRRILAHGRDTDAVGDTDRTKLNR